MFPILFAVDIGMPELIHAELGFFPTDALSVEARYGNVILNHEVGISATNWVAAGPHHFIVSGEAMFNPSLSPLRLAGGGDTLASYLGVYAGWGYRGDAGFLARAQVGGIFYADNGFAIGPNGTLGVGWVF